MVFNGNYSFMKDSDIRWQQRFQNYCKALALLKEAVLRKILGTYLVLFNEFEETMKGLQE